MMSLAQPIILAAPKDSGLYVADWLGRRSALTPSRAALILADSGAIFSYAELNERANQTANLLREQYRIGHGDRILLLADGGVVFFDLLFASAKLGAILVPLDPASSADLLVQVITDCAPRLLVHSSTATPDLLRLDLPLPQRLPFRPGEGVAGVAAQRSTPPGDGALSMDAPALILYATDTTPRPRGVIVSRRMLLWNALDTILGWQLSATDIALVELPLYQNAALGGIVLPLLYAGGCVVLATRIKPREAVPLIQNYGVSTIVARTEFYVEWCVAASNGMLARSLIKHAIASGSLPSPALCNNCAAHGLILRPGFAPNEAGPNCFTAPGCAAPLGSVGVPTFHMDARIVDEQERELPPGAVGELLLRGPAICSGYWNDPNSTAIALRGGWFHTGVLARRDEQGYFYLLR